MLRRTRFFAARSIAGLAPVALALAITALLAAPASAADAPKLLGKFDDWSAYTYGSGTDRICYVLSEPKTQAPKGATRGDVYFMVTHRPGRGIKNEISLRIGYPFSSTSKPFAMIGKDRYQMFTGVSEGGEHQFWAWLDNTKDEDKMVKALRAGASMVVKGTSSKNTLTTDTYSLKGSGGALAKADAACK
jgi:invasion protein IalB